MGAGLGGLALRAEDRGERHAGLGEPRVERQGFLKMRDGRGIQPRVLEHSAQDVVRGAVGRVEPERLAERGLGVPQPAELVQGHAEVVPGAHALRLEGDGALEQPRGLVEPALAERQGAEVMEGVGVVRP
jgi:hypothetical protein